MAEKKRVLFVSGEIAPYVKQSPLSALARTLPERMLEAGLCDPRVMMPRYGKISERKNRLHEVIRLSGTAIPMGEETETLRVKVASVPGTRLQVYFLDNSRLFKKKAIYTDASGNLLPENPLRALFFARGVLETLRKLGWAPDVMHLFSWMSGFIPYLLRTEYAGEPLFQESHIVYTPDITPVPVTLSEKVLQKLGLPETLAGETLDALARKYAHTVAADLHEVPDEDILERVQTYYQALQPEGNLAASSGDEAS